MLSLLYALLGIIVYFFLVLLAIGIITVAIVGLLIAYALVDVWLFDRRRQRKRGWDHG